MQMKKNCKHRWNLAVPILGHQQYLSLVFVLCASSVLAIPVLVVFVVRSSVVIVLRLAAPALASVVIVLRAPSVPMVPVPVVPCLKSSLVLVLKLAAQALASVVLVLRAHQYQWYQFQ